MELQEIAYGSEASSALLNSNFNCLQEQIIEINTSFETLKEQNEAQIGVVTASITSQLETFQKQLNEKIEEVNNSLSTVTTTVSSLLQNIVPDYSKGTDIKSGWTATSAGWVNWNGGQAGDKSTRYLYVNGVVVGQHSYYKYGDNYRCQFLVAKGDVITFGSKTSAKFFPCKGDV